MVGFPEGAKVVTTKAKNIEPGDRTERGLVAARRVTKWATALDENLKCILYAHPEEDVKVVRG